MFKSNASKINNQNFTPELNHHLLQGRRSRALAQVLPTYKRRWNSSSHKQAFTIIEVVLVLAIAGLIFLTVFVALPALQRSQRDAQSRNDVALIKVALENYKSNNRGKYPWSDTPLGETGRYLSPSVFSPFLEDYLSKDGAFLSPRGKTYELVGNIAPSGPYTGGGQHPINGGNSIQRIAINVGYMCSGGTFRSLGRPVNKNKYTISISLETSALNNYYCIDG